jgi:hypothetical protein
MVLGAPTPRSDRMVIVGRHSYSIRRRTSWDSRKVTTDLPRGVAVCRLTIAAECSYRGGKLQRSR